MKNKNLGRSRIATVLLLSLFIAPVLATNYFFYVQLKNKNNSPYSLSSPSAYLSARAIERRQLRAPVLDSTDLPINPSYVQQIQNTGVAIHCKSKWMNGVTVLTTDSSLMSQVRALPFVKWAKYTGKIAGAFQSNAQKTKATTDYGVAAAQIDLMNGRYLHNMGFRGKNIHVAIIDAGFTNVNINSAFDSLRLQNRLLGTKDIVNPTGNYLYSADSHGAMVLSTMAGNLPNQFLGTAPDASYWLIRTEYSPTENPFEADFWCAGIEYADSVGVDVVNSSLGYSTFDDSSMNYTYADMNGQVCRASRAATLAAQKGIIVVNSAGNEGSNSWHYITAPGDASGIVTVGAVYTTGTAAGFSSYGPSSDNRVKPEVCAVGGSAALVSTSGTTINGNGTSFASPIMAGMMASFLQASKNSQPNCTVNTLLNAVFQSGSLYNAPTAQMGYGIPNFQNAVAYLPFPVGVKIIGRNKEIVAYDNVSKKVYIRLLNNADANKVISIYSLTGVLQLSTTMILPETEISVTHLKPGVYLIRMGNESEANTQKITIQ